MQSNEIVIAGASGRVGRPIAERLLDAGAKVVLLTRAPEKLADLAARGARVVTGAQDDAESLKAHLEGRRTLFWMTPPGYAIEDYPAYQDRTARIGAKAIRQAGITNVVNLSSFGAHLATGNGPIAGLHRVEAILDDSGAHVAHLRPAVFFENYASAADSIRDKGCIFIPVAGSVRTAMVAAKDVAPIAADLLMGTSWTGRRVAAVHGPSDLSHDEAAAQLAEGLKRPVQHVEVTPEQAYEAMTGRGMSPSFARLIVELYQALQEGRLSSAEPRTEATTTPTTLRDWARDVLAPIVGAR